MKEQGYDVEYYLWVGTFAPKGTPDNVVTYSAATSLKKAAEQHRSVSAALGNLGQRPCTWTSPRVRAVLGPADTSAIEARHPHHRPGRCK